MFSTICFLFMLSFLLWMNTSERVTRAGLSRIAVYLATRRRLSRVLVVGLFLAALAMSIRLFGWGSGILAAVVVLMTAGCLSVLLVPFKYIGIRHLCAGYIVCTFVELFVM